MQFLPLGLVLYLAFLAALLGACMASFLNCFAWRIVHGESVLRGRSHCDLCGHALGLRDLIPIVSFLAARGRCRYCGEKLSTGHVWAEVFGAAVFVSLLLRYGVSLQTLEYLLLACVFMACSFADLEGYIIPDRCIIAGLVVHFAFLFIYGNFLHDLAQSAIGGFAVAGVLLVVVLIMEKLMGREAMGGGDIKLLFLTGWVLGWQKNILCLLVACLVGLVFALVTSRRQEDRSFPWGPSIALAAWATALFGEQVLGWYLGLF